MNELLAKLTMMEQDAALHPRVYATDVLELCKLVRALLETLDFNLNN